MLKRICFLFYVVALATTGHSATSPVKVMLDAGHGGHDKGALSHNHELKESYLAMKYTKLVGEALEKDPNFEVLYTRQDNRFLSLDKRVKLSATKEADIFVSIHLNASPDKRARGQEIFFQNLLPPDQESLYLAQLENEGKSHIPEDQEYKTDLQLILQDLEKNHRVQMSSQLSEAIHRNWGVKNIQRQRPIRQAPFRVLTTSKIPAVLIEIGYLSNKKEAKLLNNSSYQKRVAQGIYSGLKEFKDLMDKGSPKHLD